MGRGGGGGELHTSHDPIPPSVTTTSRVSLQYIGRHQATRRAKLPKPSGGSCAGALDPVLVIFFREGFAAFFFRCFRIVSFVPVASAFSVLPASAQRPCAICPSFSVRVVPLRRARCALDISFLRDSAFFRTEIFSFSSAPAVGTAAECGWLLASSPCNRERWIPRRLQLVAF